MSNELERPRMVNETVGRSMEILLVQHDLDAAKQVIDALAEANFQHRLTLVRDACEAADFLRRDGRFVYAPRPNLVVLGRGRSADDVMPLVTAPPVARSAS